MDEIGTRTHFIRTWTTYLHGPSADKMYMGTNFIRDVLQIEHTVVQTGLWFWIPNCE